MGVGVGSGSGTQWTCGRCVVGVVAQHVLAEGANAVGVHCAVDGHNAPCQ